MKLVNIKQDSNIDCKRNDTICFNNIPELFYPKVIMPQVRIHLLRTEILKNLPLVITKENDLYIHIRGGDIFSSSPHHGYAQPPLCFYEKIIKNRVFKNIYIISMDRSNIIVNALIKKYKNIVYNLNSIEYDMSLICRAFNIVASVSSFLFSGIKLNNNLKELWEYDIMKLYLKFFFLHHHISKFNVHYKIHTMRPSDLYFSKMYSWKRTNEQLKLMIEDKCPYDFVLTTNNI